MLFRSGRTYSPDYLDMEAKLNLILKELQDLKLRVDGLNSNSNERTLENRNDRKRDESISRLRISENDIIHKLRQTLTYLLVFLT